MGRSRTRKAHRRQKMKAADQFAEFYAGFLVSGKKMENRGNGRFELLWIDEEAGGMRLFFRRRSDGKWNIMSDWVDLIGNFESPSAAYQAAYKEGISMTIQKPSDE